MENLASLKTEFLEYLEVEKNRSQKTVRNYDFYLARFFTQSGVRSPAEITLAKVKKFRLWLNRLDHGRPENRTTGADQASGLSTRTQNYHIIALRTFLKYLAKMDVKSLAADKIELAKEPQRQVEFLEHEELQQLLAAPLQTKLPKKRQTEQNDDILEKKVTTATVTNKADNKYVLIQLRDKAILELFFSTGLRVSELAHIKRASINLKKDEFTVRGKGSKLRVVFITDQVKNCLKKYLDSRDDVSLYLFVSHDRAKKGRDIRLRATADKRGEQSLTPRSIERLINKYARAAGITKHVTPHTLRHSFATDLLRNGADIRSVQAMLGHSSITTTQIYTHITDKSLRETHQKFHSRSAAT